MNSKELEAYKKEVMKTYENTYLYAKHMAENLLKVHRGNVPLLISRPAVVGAAWKQPFPGWCGTISGFGLFIVCVGTGTITNMHMIKEYNSNNIPVDYCTD